MYGKYRVTLGRSPALLEVEDNSPFVFLGAAPHVDPLPVREVSRHLITANLSIHFTFAIHCLNLLRKPKRKKNHFVVFFMELRLTFIPRFLQFSPPTHFFPLLCPFPPPPFNFAAPPSPFFINHSHLFKKSDLSWPSTLFSR